MQPTEGKNIATASLWQSIESPQMTLASKPARRYGLYLQQVISCVAFHAHTMVLFTWTDYKTIFIPVLLFACFTAPLQSGTHLIRGCCWIWLHLAMCNVSNQCRSEEEDSVNHPWRPVPSRRISSHAAVHLRWLLVILCLLWSRWYHHVLVLLTLSLVTTTFLYDELELRKHAIGKNLCNIGGYVSFEIGAIVIMGPCLPLDAISVKAIKLSGIIIFTTIQAQDFHDIEGDAIAGRITFPIYAPEISRIFTQLALMLWSIALCWIWGVSVLISTLFIVLGCFVGLRYYWCRGVEMDRRSYILYNVWLTAVHILPIYARGTG